MVINGLENIYNPAVAKAILAFIYDNFSEETVTISEGDEDNVYKINDDKYYILSRQDQYNLIDDYNEELFSDAVSGIPNSIVRYIDKDRWIDDNGVGCIEDYWEDLFEDSLDYVDGVGDISFYKIS